ncbi:MAG TPA: S-layer homology domain-containing protein [Armatimonadota bacterium]|jgi:hypothetical protein
MRKGLFLCGAALFLAVSLPAKAQQPFEDVPKDHWAYQAVQTLQERGVVIGYPDGTFGGKRAMTRYEFAMAIKRLLEDIIDKNKGGGAGISQADLDRALQGYVKTGDLPDTSGFANKSDIPDVSNFPTKDELSNFVTKEDLQNVQKLVDEFKDELASLGTDVQNIRRDLDALKARVSAIEDRLNKWHFGGEANAIVRGDRFSKINGVRRGTDLDSRGDLNTNSGSVLDNMRFLYDLNLSITGTPVKGIEANALLNYGNYLPWVSGNRGAVGAVIPADNKAGATGTFGSDAQNGSAQVTPLLLNIKGKVGNFGPFKELSGTLGKFGTQFTPYTLKMVDPDSYTNVSYTDNGDVIMTGAKMDGRIFGKLAFSVYAAKHETFQSLGNLVNEAGYGYPVGTTWGGPMNLNPAAHEALLWDQSFGGHATYKLGRFNLGATYLEGGISNGNTTSLGKLARKGQVFGGDVSAEFGKLGFAGEFASSNTLGNFGTFEREGIYPMDRRNAWDGKLSYGLGRLTVAAGYKQVDPFFGAPGYWGAIGRWKNPTNIKGVNGSIGYNFGEKLSLQGQAEFYNSVVNNAGNTNGSNGVQHFQAGVKYKLTSANRVDLGWEQARYHPMGQGVSLENYYNIGFGHDFSDSTSLKLLYQIIDFKAGAGGVLDGFGTANYKGGVAVGQFSVKF